MLEIAVHTRLQVLSEHAEDSWMRSAGQSEVLQFRLLLIACETESALAQDDTRIKVEYRNVMGSPEQIRITRYHLVGFHAQADELPQLVTVQLTEHFVLSQQHLEEHETKGI